MPGTRQRKCVPLVVPKTRRSDFNQVLVAREIASFISSLFCKNRQKWFWRQGKTNLIWLNYANWHFVFNECILKGKPSNSYSPLKHFQHCFSSSVKRERACASAYFTVGARLGLCRTTRGPRPPGTSDMNTETALSDLTHKPLNRILKQ